MSRPVRRVAPTHRAYPSAILVDVEHIAINGLDIAVEVVGTGPPLVLLHGILVDSRAWRPQLDHLRDEFTVVAWDAPGCGRSVDPHETWRFPEYADCLAELMAALRLTTPIIGGLSWGGTLAIAFQRQHPGVASALILAGAYRSAAAADPGRGPRMQRRATPGVQRRHPRVRRRPLTTGPVSGASPRWRLIPMSRRSVTGRAWVVAMRARRGRGGGRRVRVAARAW